MIVSKIKEELNYKTSDVWEIVTNLNEYSWRSDLSKIEVINEKEFVEYDNKGYKTNFTISVFSPMERYEFEIENDNMVGHWIGKFEFSNNKTTLEFIENIKVKNRFMKIFAKMYLKKQQRRYMTDLKKALSLNKTMLC